MGKSKSNTKKLTKLKQKEKDRNKSKLRQLNSQKIKKMSSPTTKNNILMLFKRVPQTKILFQSRNIAILMTKLLCCGLGNLGNYHFQ